MFKYVIKLKVILRQQNLNDDSIQQKFIELLPRLRDGKMTVSDWQVLLSRTTSPARLLFFQEAIRLFIDNRSASRYNDTKLLSLNNPLTNIKSVNSSPSARSADDEQFRGLCKSFFLCSSAHIVFSANLWTEMGIVNGAFGIIRDIVYPSEKNIDSLPDVIFVEVKDYIGPKFFTDCRRKNWIPINALSIYSHEAKATRMQYSIRLAYAMTVHKAQGLTLKQVNVVIKFKNIFKMFFLR